MNMKGSLLAGALAVLLSGQAFAADFSDPDWPCIQRKVERLSIGLMWPAPLAEIKLTPETAAAAHDLAATLALRRVTLEEARAKVDSFAEVHGHDPVLMGHVFEQVFDSLSNRRGRILTGIGKFSRSQIALAERIDASRTEMETQMAQDAPDYDRVDALEEQLDWDTRIHTDRQRTITYLCETPVLLEKRLYAISQMLQEAGQAG